MKRENLYLVSAALLASTAISTSATAGVFGIIGGYGESVSSAAPKRVSAQVFASTPTTATVIGGAQTTGNAALVYRFGSALSMNQSSFSSTVGVTGAQFSTANVSGGTSIRGITGTVAATGSVAVTANEASITCTGLVATTAALIINGCTVVAFTGSGSIAGFAVSLVTFDNATGLATVGGTIALAGTTNLSATAGSGAVFDTTAAQTVITSVNSLSTTVTASTGVSTINVSANPAFSRLSNGSLTAVLGTINVTGVGALAGDLSTVITGATAVSGTSFIRLNGTTLLADDALASVELRSTAGNATLSRVSSSFGGGAVTFTIVAANINDIFSVVVNFNGTGQIDAASGNTVDVSFGAIGGAATTTANSTAPPGVTGSAIASLVRSGLNIQVNSLQPGVAQGARTYTSLLRIVNTGATAGTASVVLRNANDGTVLGTYTSPSIPGGAQFQVSSATMEASIAGLVPTASIGYNATITGNITGYVQHVNWNQDAGFFSDLSAARIGSGGTNP